MANNDIHQFVTSLISTDPKPAHSVQLEIDVDGDIHALFEVLLLIMTDMLKRWYTPPITIGRISETNLEKMTGYYASFGYKFNLMVEDIAYNTRINNREYLAESRLESMTFKMAHEGKVYAVSFSNLPIA